MAIQNINVGATANDGNGDPLRSAFIKCNDNFDDLDTTKQDTLVSGTNIKTLEGQSLLGSGNIDLTKSDVGLGNVDNTSDVNKPISSATQTALNAKQDTLVSGTNIKTINGNTILGSGDLVVGGTTPSLQDVTDIGNSTTNAIQMQGYVPLYSIDNSVILGAINLPNGNSYGISSEETAIGVYNSGNFDTGFYAKRNIQVNGGSLITILELSTENSSVNFTIFIKSLSEGKFYTINGILSIDWVNEKYKYRMTNTNGTIFDNEEILKINILFGFGSSYFEIRADNQSSNDIIININANIL